MTESIIWLGTAALLVIACDSHDHADHPHGDEGGTAIHPARDLATQPCNATTWPSLGLDLRECQLVGVDLSGVSLRRANLSDSDLSRADLSDADLFNAELVRAKLAGANLAGANLAGADLSGADLTEARLAGADLTSAVLSDAIVERVYSDASTVCPDGTTGPCW